MEGRADRPAPVFVTLTDLLLLSHSSLIEDLDCPTFGFVLIPTFSYRNDWLPLAVCMLRCVAKDLFILYYFLNLYILFKNRLHLNILNVGLFIHVLAIIHYFPY